MYIAFDNKIRLPQSTNLYKNNFHIFAYKMISKIFILPNDKKQNSIIKSQCQFTINIEENKISI